MTLAVFIALALVGAVLAGFIGALTGLGGGVVLTPLLTLVFGVDFHYAAGASLICVIATSAGAGASFSQGGFTNVRVGLVLLGATVAGAVVGALIAGHAGTRALTLIFGVVLIASALLSLRGRRGAPVASSDRLASWLRLAGSEPTPEGPRPYHVRRVPLGFAIMGGAGLFSGMLGIGGGAFKVLAMDEALRLPFKVSTTTSNFMMGMTALASVGLYLQAGWLHPLLIAPVVLGVLVGARFGARLVPRLPVATLRKVFAGVLLVVAVQMIWKGLA